MASVVGLFFIYRGLRRNVGLGVALLSTLLCLGGTSLLAGVAGARTADVLSFAIVAGLVFESARVKSRAVLAAAWLTAAFVPLLARYASGADLQSLFGADGFFSLTPTTYVALLGTVVYVRKNPFWSVASLSLLALWFGTGSGLLAMIGPLAPGLALVLDWARRRPLVAVAPVIAFAIVWNYWLMVQYTAGMIPKDAPVSFAAMVRQQADVHTRPPYIYPFAFPGNVFFAWREGVPLDRYELLAAEPRRDRFELTIDRNAERFLLAGWGPPGANEAGPFRWLDAPEAVLTFPLQPTARDVTVKVLATARGEDASRATELTFTVNGHPIGRAHVTPAAATDTDLTIAQANVGRVLRAGYNRLSIVISGNHRIAIHKVRIVPAS